MGVGPTPFEDPEERDRRDEDENLGGAGNLERGEPISRFFETLEYRVTNPEGDLPEVPGRRPNGGVPVACANTSPGQRCRGSRECRRRRAHGGCGFRTGQGREGGAPGRKKPRRARMSSDRRDAESTPQRDAGIKPLQRGRAGPEVRNGGDHRRAVEDPGRDGIPNREHPTTTAPCAEAERRRSRVRARGDVPGRNGNPPFGSVTPRSQSQEGKLCREAKAIRIVSSSEGRTP
jgi:hypothetical protein